MASIDEEIRRAEERGILLPDSCLNADQSGIDWGTYDPGDPPQHGLSLEEAFDETIELDSMTLEAIEAVEGKAGVRRPDIARFIQGRAVTRRDRGRANIDQVTIHTPEGGVRGTLSVLRTLNASWDWFLPPSGRLIKCNRTRKYIAWHNGRWSNNERSIGIEQWDFAARMHRAGEAHYRRLGRLCGFLVEVFNLARRWAPHRDTYGFQYHRWVTPDWRCDPDACGQSRFRKDMLMDFIGDAVRGAAGA